jgi:hypothetical protein
MSATTMAIATTTETPPGRGLDHAALPVSVAAISDRTFSAARLNPHGAGWCGAIQAALTMI